ncbi:electron transport complex subunit RsxC [Photobacterium sp. MCCC 1A19761]|uniref:electron transport complex subunit RsxC n=1 Tax=Photobacterium sp. MCCC 1A19761 TaxID=3115000 RepID=UPI00307CDACB
MSRLALFSQPDSVPTSWLQRLIQPLQRAGYRWHGGIQLEGYKSLSNGSCIQRVSPTTGTLLSIPLGNGRHQATPCVNIGQQVRKGEVIARGQGHAPWVHASTSGQVVALQSAYVADLQSAVPAITIAADGRDEWMDDQPLLPPQSAEALAQLSWEKGIVGLGGAGFPTGIKISGARHPDMLLINGAECEPFITCDDRLMRERASEIIRAADYLAQTLSITQIRVGVEPDKSEAMFALKKAISEANSTTQVVCLPHRYPAGGQPMLIKSLSGRNLLPGMLPSEIGVMVLNVATLYKLGQAVFHQEPLVSRIVTLTGHVGNPGNVEVPIGMPVADLLKQASLREDHTGIHVGGPMMGRLLSHESAVISKTSSCLIARSVELFPRRPEPSSCIRCNRCTDACPIGLQPLKLYEANQREDKKTLQQEQLTACIECGACSEVCPSHLPLRDSFRDAKQMMSRSVAP